MHAFRITIIISITFVLVCSFVSVPRTNSEELVRLADNVEGGASSVDIKPWPNHRQLNELSIRYVVTSTKNKSDLDSYLEYKIWFKYTTKEIDSFDYCLCIKDNHHEPKPIFAIYNQLVKVFKHELVDMKGDVDCYSTEGRLVDDVPSGKLHDLANRGLILSCKQSIAPGALPHIPERVVPAGVLRLDSVTTEQGNGELVAKFSAFNFSEHDCASLFPDGNPPNAHLSFVRRKGDKFPLAKMTTNGFMEPAEAPESERLWLRITHIEPENKEDKFPAWIAVEPVLPEPYSIIPEYEPKRKQ